MTILHLKCRTLAPPLKSQTVCTSTCMHTRTLARTCAGRDTIHTSMNLCPAAKLDKADDVVQLRDWLAAAWDFMAMGNFPYPSG